MYLTNKYVKCMIIIMRLQLSLIVHIIFTKRSFIWLKKLNKYKKIHFIKSIFGSSIKEETYESNSTWSHLYI